MEDYCDISIVLTKLRRGQINGTASFKNDIIKIIQRRSQYIKEDISIFKKRFQEVCVKLDEIPLKL